MPLAAVALARPEPGSGQVQPCGCVSPFPPATTEQAAQPGETVPAMSSQAPAQPDQTWLEMQPVPEFLTFMPWPRGALQAWRVLGAAHTPPPGRSRAARQWEARGPHSRAKRDLEPSGLLWRGPTDQGRRERASLIRHTQVQRGCSTQLWRGSEGDQGSRLGTVGGLCGWEALGSLGQVSARVLASQDTDSGHTCHAGQDDRPGTRKWAAWRGSRLRAAGFSTLGRLDPCSPGLQRGRQVPLESRSSGRRCGREKA